MYYHCTPDLWVVNEGGVDGCKDGFADRAGLTRAENILDYNLAQCRRRAASPLGLGYFFVRLFAKF
jgi:hypothetical protein